MRLCVCAWSPAALESVRFQYPKNLTWTTLYWRGVLTIRRALCLAVCYARCWVGLAGLTAVFPLTVRYDALRL
jgi:hypothetical protein